MARIKAPWTVEQVVALNVWQRTDHVHPFTCGSGERMDSDHVLYANLHGGDFGQLVATPNGWFCPSCTYRQDWAHDFMVQPPPPLPGFAADHQDDAP